MPPVQIADLAAGRHRAPALRAARPADLDDEAFAPELPELTALFKMRPLRAWLDLLEGEETCVGPVLTLTEAGSARL
jgi:hypothetical protein